MRNPFRRQIPPKPGRPRGVVRVDARTKKLTKRLQPGQIAVIDHTDLDRVAAEALVECQPAAVLNAAPSVSGRYPNLGPGILLEAGIPLIDDLGPDIMRLREGQEVVIEVGPPEGAPAADLPADLDAQGASAASSDSAPDSSRPAAEEPTTQLASAPAGTGTPVAPAGQAQDPGEAPDEPERRRRGRHAAQEAGEPAGGPAATTGMIPAARALDQAARGSEPVGSARAEGASGTVEDQPGSAVVRVVSSGQVVATGKAQTPQSVAALMEQAKAGLAVQLEAFAANTMEYMRGERDLLLNGVGLPQITTDMSGRHVLVVVRGYSYKEDLAALKPYVREYKPVIIGVDGGADAVLDAGMRLDMIVGDMDSVSDKALRSGAEIVVHAYRDGRAPGLARVEELGVDHLVFAATGTSEDIAMLMADAAGAELIVAVGTHATLTEFLDKGRAGMSSTFLTRLKVGSRLVDAKGVSRLYRTRISGWQLALLALAGVVALVAAMAATPAGQTVLGLVVAGLEDLLNWLRALVGLAPRTPTV